MNYSNLSTEKRNPKSVHIDKMSTSDMLKLMNDENKIVPLAVDSVLPAIQLTVDSISARMLNGGRLIYIGAGTSGRLGVIDAAECPPTFGVSPDSVIGLIAGGYNSMYSASEIGEDNASAGVNDIASLNLSPLLDSVIGISAAGKALYVVEAIKFARNLGCFTASISSDPSSPLALNSDVPISPDTGPEVITGSTRLKAGSAQKIILNLISTAVMVKSGMVYENLMINLKPTNDKLRDRAIRILSEITGLNYTDALLQLDIAGGSIKDAIYNNVKRS